ncbi:MAG: 5-bromo-4-chloroindolyl phosphate hydrolysis family protein [bacterium]|nr:5-bromo-4-chloroindolyl phosphate hydrolysis family protein [bacterium]
MYRNNLGDQIKNIVEDAVDSCNFGDLNNKIKNTADRAIDEFNRATAPFQYGDKRRRNSHNVPPFGQGGQGGQGGPGGQGGQGGAFWGNGPFNGQNGPFQGQPFNRQSRPNNGPFGGPGKQFNGQASPFNQQRDFRRQDTRTRQYGRTATGNKFIKKRKEIGKVSSILFIVFGSIGLASFGITSFVLFMVWLGTGALSLMLSTLGSIFGVVTLIFASMLGIGIHKKKRIKRFHVYETLLGEKKYCEIERMAQYTGKSKKYVLKDLKKMIMLGFFVEGHIDDTKTCFIEDNATYEQYMVAQESYKQRLKEEAEKKVDTSKKDIDPDLLKAIQDGQKFIEQVKAANEDIPGEEISRKLYRLEDVISKIFVCVEKHPEKLPEIRKFMEYYLPITLKLVNAYKEFDAQPIQGENITNSKKEIEATLDTINTAFEKLLDSLYEDEAMEVSSDISVLNTLFAQEGLTKKDFDLK